MTCKNHVTNVDVPPTLTNLCLPSDKRDLANSVDPDQTPQNAASDLGSTLFALHTEISIKHGNNKN